MKRRSKVSSKRAKGGPRNPAKRKPRTAHKEQSNKTGMAWLTRELDEAREQQRATSELLRVISQASFQLQSVLQGVAETASKRRLREGLPTPLSSEFCRVAYKRREPDKTPCSVHGENATILNWINNLALYSKR